MCESLKPTTTCEPDTAIVVSLWVVWSMNVSVEGSFTLTFVIAGEPGPPPPLAGATAAAGAPLESSSGRCGRW